MIRHTPDLLMTPRDAREILSSDRSSYMKHGNRKASKCGNGLFKLEELSNGFSRIGNLEETIDFLFYDCEVFDL